MPDKHPCVIVCPGGGYSGLSDREDEVIAVQYLAAGFATFILRYSVKENAKDFQPLKEAALAMHYERAALYRDRIRAVESVMQKQKAIVSGGGDQDVVATIRQGDDALVQLLIMGFVIFSSSRNYTAVGILTLGINSGAYVAEIVRGGIMSIDDGQTEAGRSLGFNYIQTMYHIVFPQAFKAVLPSLANEFITLLKETSVAFYIGVADLTQGGLKIRSITYSNFMPLIAIAVVYLVLVLGLSYLVSLLERRLRNNKR